MKELEKTKRISISAILFLLVIVIGLLTFRKPQFSFSNSSAKTLEVVTNSNHQISLDDFKNLDPSTYKLIDIRTNFDFSKGHLDNAINIPISQILEAMSNGSFSDAEPTEKTVIIYGEHPQDADAAWMLLFQMGYEQIKILSIRTYYENRQFHVKNVDVGKPSCDFAETMRKASIQKIKKVEAKPAPAPKKKVITQPKKKKKMPEGGC